MTGPRLDFDRFESFSSGYEASKQNEYWLKVQGEIFAQMKKDLGLIDQTLAMQYGAPAPPISTMEQSQNIFKQFGMIGKVSGSSPEGQARISNVGEIARMPLPELHGRAKALGIERPDDIPDQELRQLVAQRRLDVAPEDYRPLNRVANMVADWGIGAAEFAVGLGSRLGGGNILAPFTASGEDLPAYMRDVARQYKNKEATEEMFAKLEEGVRANKTADELHPFWGGLNKFSGSMLAGAAIGGPIFSGIFGATGRVLPAALAGSRAGSITRGVIAGAGTSLLFDANSEKPWAGSAADWGRIVEDGMDPYERIEAGANAVFGNRAMSAVVGGLFGALYGRVQRDFPHQGNIADAANRGQGRTLGGLRENWASRDPNVVDAEWWFDTELQPYGQRLLKSGSDDAGTTLFGSNRPTVVGEAPPTAPEPYAIQALEQQYLRALPEQGKLSAGPAAPMQIDIELPYLVNFYQQKINASMPPGTPELQLAPDAPLPPPVLELVMQDMSPIMADELARILQGGQMVTMQDVAQMTVEFNNSGLTSMADPSSVYPVQTPLLQGPPVDDAQLMRDALRDNTFPNDDFVDVMERYRAAAQPRRTTTTPDDIALRVADLRAQQSHEERVLGAGGLTTNDYEGEIRALKTAAGMDPYGDDPLHWDAFKKNPPNPKTAAYNLVEAYGTVVRNQRGEPLMTYHGTAVAFDEIDPAKFSPGLAGRAFYVTDAPPIAGGDVNPLQDERGYSEMRSTDLNRDRSFYQREIQRAHDLISEYETLGDDSGISFIDYNTAQTSIPVLQAELAVIPDPAANVRMQYVAAKKVYDFDGPIDREEAFNIMKRANSMYPEYDFQDTFNLVNSMTSQTTIQGKILWDSMSYESMAGRNNSRGDDEYNFGEDHTNEVLRDLGYDAIHYLSNQRMGSGVYKDAHAWAVFDPRNVVPVFLPEEVIAEQAARLGIQMSKQADIMTTPVLDELASRSKFTDADVVIAQIASSPGGIHLIRGVTDPSALVAEILSEDFNVSTEGMAKAYQLVEREGRFDLLVSSLPQLTDNIVADYARTGFFVGMDVVKVKNGAIAKVIGVMDDGLKVQTPPQLARGANVGSSLKFADVAPNTRGTSTIESPVLYEQFKQYAVQETNERINSSGQQYLADWFDDAVFVRLPDLLKDFLDESGISDLGIRGAIVRDFEMRRVEEAKQFAPEYFEALDELRAQSDAVSEMASTMDRMQPGAAEYANLRGFTLITNAGKPGFVLEDMFTEAKLPMADEDAVIAFLNTYTRDLPDHTPATPFPMELAEVPNQSQGFSPSGRDWEQQFIEDIAFLESEEFLFDSPLVSITDSFESYGPPRGDPFSGRVGGGGSGGKPPKLPRAASDFPEPQRRITQGDAEARTTKENVKRALFRKEHHMPQLMSRYEGLLMRAFTPMRSVFSRLQDDLGEIGITGLRPWEDFDNIIAGLSKSHNFSNPILNELATELRFVPRKLARRGTWWQLWEVADPIERMGYARGLGMSDDAVRSFHKVDVVLEKMLGGDYDAVLQFKSFVASVRTAQQRGDFSSAAYTGGADVSKIAHFVEHSMDIGAKMTVNDPRVLLPDFVRSYSFAKYAGDAWNKSLDTWRAVENVQDGLGRRPFAGLARLVLDWQDYVQRGYQPGTDFALTAIQSVMNNTVGRLPGGAKMSRGEARNMIQVLQTGFYRGAMGIRAHVMIRDAIQPLFAIPFVDAGHLFGVFKTLGKGSNSKSFEELMTRSFESGVAEKAMPQLESPGTFEGLMLSAEEGGVFTPHELAKRNVAAERGDAMIEMLTPGARGFVKKHLDTMRFYTAQGRWHRVIVGEAAYNKFMTEHAGWQNARRQAIESGSGQVPTFEDFAESINLGAWGRAEAGGIASKLGVGDVLGGAYQFMRMVADMTQYGYGSRHAPMAMRTTAGKLGLMLGNFSMQTVDMMRNIARGRSRRVGAKMAATLGMIGYGLKVLEDETGWSTWGMNPISSLTFIGGPIVRKGVDYYNNLDAFTGSLYAEMTDRPQDTRDIGRLRKISIPGAVLGAAQAVNPLAGVNYNLEGLSQIVQSGDPLNSSARFLVTGNNQGFIKDNERRLRQFPEFQVNEFQPPVQPLPSDNYRAQPVPIRLPGGNQYQALRQADSLPPLRPGDVAASPQEMQIRSQFNATQDVLRSFIERDSAVRADSSKLGTGGGAF